MRVLMLSQFYSPFLGGAERHVQDLSRELVARGHEVAVATIWHEGLSEYEIDRGVRIYRIRSSVQRISGLFKDNSHYHAPPFPDPELTQAIQQVVRIEKPQIVHAHNWMVHSFLPLKRWSGAKLVLTLHDYNLVCATHKLLYHGRLDAPCSGPGFKKCLSCAADHYGSVKGVVTATGNWLSGLYERKVVDMFIPVSQFTAVNNRLIGSGLPYRVIPNFITGLEVATDDSIEPYIQKLPAGDFLMYAGAFGSYKGLDVLLEAYAKLKDAPPLVIIGYRTNEYSVTAQIPEKVIILTDWPHTAVMAAWQRCLIGLVPSLTAETFGLVALEAMAYGRPVVASRIGGLAEIVIDGETGFLVPPGDVSALQNAIERLLNDPKLRLQMGLAAGQRATAYSMNQIVPRIEALYQEITGNAADAALKVVSEQDKQLLSVAGDEQ